MKKNSKAIHEARRAERLEDEAWEMGLRARADRREPIGFWVLILVAFLIGALMVL